MTKLNKTLHREELTSAQLHAISLFVMGQSDQAVAAAVHRTRQTVASWRRFHPSFQAALNRQRAELWSASVDRVRSLLPKAIHVIEKALEGEGDVAVRAALALLKLVNLPLEQIGPQTEEEIVQEAAEHHDRTMLAVTIADPNGIREELLAHVQDESEDTAAEVVPLHASAERKRMSGNAG